MYTLNCWESHLGIVAIDFLEQAPARIVVGPITAYVSGKVTQVSKMTDLHP